MHPSLPYPVADHEGEYFYDAREPSKRASAAGTVVQAAVDAAPKTTAEAAPKPTAAAVPKSAAVSTPVTPPTADGSAVLSTRWLEEQPSIQRRLHLPDPKEKQKSVSLWSIIKECIGKDLTRICLPVYFNEPLSALQRVGEEFEYAYILDRAAACEKGSPERLMWIAVFAMTGCEPGASAQ